MLMISGRARAVFLAGASALSLTMASGAALAQPAAQDATEPAAAGDPQAGDPNVNIIVTAQRRAESIQDVPITVSAFNEQALTSQRIDGGPELVRAVPNVIFAKGYFVGFNFQIRGVGTQLGTASGDSGVGIHLNNVPLTTSRFFEAEFFDTERVEVLRGPQGTLYGRNATGGVVNVVTARPTNQWEGMVSGEVATYDSIRIRGTLNMPLIDDVLALRVAGAYLRRSGFGENTANGRNVNGRDLWSTRVTLLARPFEGFEATLLWQHFEEDDNRTRTGGLLCVRDAGPASVGGVAVTNTTVRAYLSQGCADARLDGNNSNGTPNSLSTIFGYFTETFGITSGDYNAGATVSRNLHDTASLQTPAYRANSDLFQMHLAMDVTPDLKFTAITSYLDDSVFSSRDFGGYIPTQAFATTGFTPGGRYADPQLGTLDRFSSADYFNSDSQQFTQEVRLDTSFGGRFNFSVGANYVNYNTSSNYYVLSNVFTLTTQILNTFGGFPTCPINSPSCRYIDPGVAPDSSGHNYFLSSSPYELESRAIFGEVYFDITDQLKLTVGGRYTRDHKEQINLPVRLLTLGTGHPPGVQRLISIDFSEPTGRIALDWRPDISFTDETLFYAIASRGYKAGGTNPPPSFTPLPPYRPEFINAIEIGTKNTLMNGRMTLNLAAFNYDYTDYQVAEIRDRTQQIQNISARVRGLEVETAFEPLRGLRFNATLGLLDSRITEGAFVDPTNFTGNDPTLTFVKNTAGSVCAVNTAALATYLATNPSGAAFVNSVCAGLIPGLVPNRNGIPTSLVGNELPNAPRWTFSLGAQYTTRLGGDWRATLRGDYYAQSSSFARTYNTDGDYLPRWDNVNATLTIENASSGWEAQLFVKNLFDNQPLVNTFLADTITGLTRFGFTTDPRVIGFNLTKRF